MTRDLRMAARGFVALTLLATTTSVSAGTSLAQSSGTGSPPTTSPPVGAAPSTTKPPPSLPASPAPTPDPPVPEQAPPGSSVTVTPAPADAVPAAGQRPPAMPVPPAAVLLEQPPVTDSAGLAALAARAESLLQARAGFAALRGDVAGTAADPALDGSLAAARLEFEWSTVRNQLARGIAARTFRSSLEILADWERTPVESLQVVLFALSQLGRPVRYGSAGPDAFDSSGLTLVAWARAGVSLPHYSKSQLAALPRVAAVAVRPGDLVAYGEEGKADVGLYVGGGLVVMAASETPAVELATAHRPDVAGVVRPAGEISLVERDPNAPPPSPPTSATPQMPNPSPRDEPIGSLATEAINRLDLSLRLDVQARVRALALTTRAGLGGSITRGDAAAGVPAALVPVYQAAARTCAAPADWWSVLAAIGAHESGHGTANGAHVEPDGTVTPPIYGPRLDGGQFAVIRDTDGGRYDADPDFDRAVGPMQFIPSTWIRHGVRAPERGPGEPDPQNIYDAIYSAAAYLCATQSGSITDPRAAVLSYNRSEVYAKSVLARSRELASALAPAPPNEKESPEADDSAQILAEVHRARSALSSQMGYLAEQLARRFGVDQLGLLDEWRFAPPGALRVVLWALGRTSERDNPGSREFVVQAWRRGGVTLSSDAVAFEQGITPIDGAQLRPGDLVMVGPLGAVDHVALYVGAGIAISTDGFGGAAHLGGYNPADLARFARVAQPGPLAPAVGFLLRPVDGPIVSGFGPRHHPVHGGVRFHGGLDLDAAMGDSVHAAAAGVVVVASAQGGYGKAVVVEHGNGLATWYAHLSEIDVRVGDVVQAGDVLGRVGSTGVSTGPHLHFEVRIFGQNVDPRQYLAPRPDDQLAGAAQG